MYCTDCKYFYYDKAPMSETYVGCDKQHWSTPSYEIDFRSAVRKATSCQDFKAITLKELETGLLSSDIGKPRSIPVSPIDRKLAEAIQINLEMKRKLKNGRKKER